MQDQISETNKSGAERISMKLEYFDIANIQSLVKKIDLASLPNIEAPSMVYQYDSAPLARLFIIQQFNVYKSQSFDHGNPPNEIADLVKEMLSIEEKIE